jgi:methylglyoxal synthase
MTLPSPRPACLKAMEQPETSAMARIGLVAHDDRKQDLADWAAANRQALAGHDLFATGTTGGRVREATGLELTLLKSGPLGGDAQLGAMIAEDRLDALIFFIDPLSALPHDVDVKALTRLATLYDTLFACNRATADAVLGALKG